MLLKWSGLSSAGRRLQRSSQPEGSSVFISHSRGGSQKWRWGWGSLFYCLAASAHALEKLIREPHCQWPFLSLIEKRKKKPPTSDGCPTYCDSESEWEVFWGYGISDDEAVNQRSHWFVVKQHVDEDKQTYLWTGQIVMTRAFKGNWC